MTVGRGFFVTGTDTDVGKTWAVIALMRWFRERGNTVSGMKPVAAGCEWRDGALRNFDALLIQENSSIAIDYDQVNPYAFALSVSPHLACGKVEVNAARIIDIYSEIARRAEVVIVEGAGGWYSPLGGGLDNAGLAVEMGLPVILVVGIRLGCLNHARLTYEAIQRSGVSCCGWIAVQLSSEMPAFEENIVFLKNALDTSLLGVLPYLPKSDFDYLATKFCKNLESL